jgi:hypothetical protein
LELVEVEETSHQCLTAGASLEQEEACSFRPVVELVELAKSKHHREVVAP